MPELSALRDYFDQVRVNSDFTQFVTNLLNNNIIYYFHFVATGNIVFVKRSGELIMLKSDSELFRVNRNADIELVKLAVKKHFSGNISYDEYRLELAYAGISKWIVDLNEMVRFYVTKRDLRIHREKLIF